MPRKNTRRGGRANAIFHVYNREKSKAAMFRDDEDRRFFKALFARHLHPDRQHDDRGRPYTNYRDRVHIWSLSIKTNHFHLVLFQIEADGAGALMNTVLATYVRYFNRKYGTGGEMFVGEVRMRPAESRREVVNAVAYVHENHGDHCYCEFCSHGAFVGHPAHVPPWLDVDEALENFGGVAGYLDWLHARRLQRRVLGAPEPF